MVELSVGTVDVYAIRETPAGWGILVLQRAFQGTRCPGAWETVHGRIEAGEEPEEAAVRELREETALEADRLYSVTVQPYYLAQARSVQLAVVFAAFIREPAEVDLGSEHGSFEWLAPKDASRRFFWPRERDALRDILSLLGGGNAAAAEDVLRVR